MVNIKTGFKGDYIKMLEYIFKKIFGSSNDREVKRLMSSIVAPVNALELELEAKPEGGLRDVTEELKKRLSDGETLEDILPYAFAAVREASKRTLGLRHFDVQLIGGAVLNQGKIAEMKTGEGKTLMATLPLYLNALTGKGAHLITVNDYLAKRDAVWMGVVYRELGLTVGVIQGEGSFIFDYEFQGGNGGFYRLRPTERKVAYGADITYGTNNEYGFDYLRDNMKFDLDEYVQRDLNFAIVDEVDSILIDDARTPLIISGATEDSVEKYYEIDKVIPGLKEETHYTVDEKGRQAYFTDEGVAEIERRLNVENLFDPQNIESLHHVNQALRAHTLFKIDIDYVVNDGEVVIVDEFTGRLMSGRRWGDGLHQAVEAKENVTIEKENQTLATITFQNFFRMYNKLAGMTGTADTEAVEFSTIYGLEVLVVPTNKPMARLDYADVIYKTEEAKFRAVITDIKVCRESRQPVLVGTISIDNSEKVSKLLTKAGVKHNVLNAKQHENEANIVAQAGKLGAVTLSTTMAGRGTDIVLGGNPAFIATSRAGNDDTTEEYKKAFSDAEVKCSKEKQEVLALGGLHIIGTERHESRRIDNQLRGRSGRQGDPGSARYYISLDDDLMRIFGSEKIAAVMSKLGMEEDEAIEHSFISKALENAQKKVEGHNFDMRKHLLEYDDVLNQQRHVVYDYRKKFLSGDGTEEMISGFIDDVCEDVLLKHVEDNSDPSEWDIETLSEAFGLGIGFPLETEDVEGAKNIDGLYERVLKKAETFYNAKKELIGTEDFKEVEKILTLQTLDNLWKDHLLTMDHLKTGIGMRGYGQKNPLSEYKKEGFELFSSMIDRLKSDVIEKLFKVHVEKREDVERFAPMGGDVDITLGRGSMGGLPEMAAVAGSGSQTGTSGQQTIVRHSEKVGRNDPCPCGSGKKYKKCHGK